VDRDADPARRDHVTNAKTTRTTEPTDDATASTDATAPAPAPEVAAVADPVPTWDEVAVDYGPKVFAMAYRLTGDRQEAEDLAQDVFVRVYRNLDKYSPGTFDGWLYRITKNLFLDRIRRRRRIRMVPLPDEDWHATLGDDAPDPSELVDDGMLAGHLEQAIAKLPPTFRTAVVLCDVQGMTYDEIAEATGWPMGTVRSRIHRGRRLLRAALTDD
jgi:RNA polymerase sigma-70 factor (ECF subfamily)